MALKIDKTELINALGYLGMHTSRILAECSQTIPDDGIIEDELVSIQKLFNTVLGKQAMTKINTTYTDLELQSMRIKP